MRVALGESGPEVFPLILGGAEFGWNVDLESSHEILDRYVELGGNTVHTADAYSAGRSEHIIGQWIRSRGLRDDVVLAVRVGGHADNPGLGPVNLVRAVEASLTRLGTDRIDVLYLDAHAARTRRSKTRSRRPSGSSKRARRGRSARSASPPRSSSRHASWHPPATRASRCSTRPYNVLRRQEFEGDVRLVASAQNVAVTPSHALEHGFLSGRHRQRSRLGHTVRGAQMVGSLNRRGTRTLRALDAVAAELQVPDAAVAVAWLLAQKTVVAPDRQRLRGPARRGARAGRRRAPQPRPAGRARTARRSSPGTAAARRTAGAAVA